MQLSIHLGFRVYRSANRDESGGIGESVDCLLQCSDGGAAPFTSFGSFNRTQSCARTTQHADHVSRPGVVAKRPTTQGPRCSTQRLGITPLRAFISVPASFVGGVPLTRAMNPWAMPEAST